MEWSWYRVGFGKAKGLTFSPRNPTSEICIFFGSGIYVPQDDFISVPCWTSGMSDWARLTGFSGSSNISMVYSITISSSTPESSVTVFVIHGLMTGNSDGEVERQEE